MKLPIFAILLSFVLLPISAKAQYDTTPTTSDSEGYQIPPEHPLWHGDYHKTNWEIVLGYVNKSWICTYDSGTQREDLFGDTNEKFIHGVQLGGLYTPSFDWGLGLRTGLLLEAYESRSSYVRTKSDKFTEVDLCIPLHGSFFIPFGVETALNLYGGLGFQWAIEGRYENRDYTYRWYRPRYVTVEYQEYGNGWPQKVNWQAECGLNFRWHCFALNFSYSFGITDHGIQRSLDGGQTYETAKRSRQDKMQASLFISL